MQVELTSGEQARVDAKGTENLQAYLKYLQARKEVNKLNVEGNSLGRQLAQESIELDPQYPMPYRILASTHRMDVYLGTSKSPKESIGSCMKLLKKAIALDDTYAEAYGALGFTLSMIGKHEQAVSTAEKAVALDPNSANSYAMLGHTLRMANIPKEAIQAYTKAIRLNPIPPTFYQFGLGMSYSLDGQYEKGIQWCEKAVKQNPDDFIARIMLTAVYSMAGKDDKARAEAVEVLRINPKYNLTGAEKRASYRYKDKMIAALRRAGIPEKPPQKLPDKPSIAVLPFDNMSDDPRQTYFSDGISEDLITDLSKISGLLVISRMSSFSYKGKKLKIQQIAEELGVRYVLEGSVRKAEDRVRINAQLIDAPSGHHVWAERYDGNMTDIFALQDNINRKIISALALKLTSSEQHSITDKGTENLQAYDEFLKGWQGYQQLTKAGFAEAKIRLEKAIELDPEFTRAYAALAVLYWKATHFAAPEHREGLGLTTRQKLLAVKTKPQFLVKKAMKKPTALAHGLMSQFYLMRYQHDEALAEIERALAMDPNDPELYTWMSEILWLMGKSSEAIESANMGLRLDPNNPATYLRQLGRSYLPDGDLEKSLQLLERANRLNPELSGTVAFHKSVIYGIQGNIKEARPAYEIFLKSRMYPVRNLSSILNYFPFADPKNLEPIANALVKAGAPGNPTDYYRILKENRIKGPAVKSLLFGRKIFGVAMSTGKPIEWEWADNGEFKFTMGKFQTMGNSWIEGDIFFVQFEKIFGGLPYGWVIYRNPDGSCESKDQYLMVSDLGTMNHFALAD
jgi:TolB-like protein/Flp pilus assembly protein TadD